MTNKSLDKILGSFLGSAIGDAMGAPTETRPIYLIKQDVGDGEYVKDYKKPREDTLAAGAPKGMVTDDFSVSFLSAKHFVNQDGKVSKQASIDALLEWSTYEYFYTNHSGPTSRRSIEKLKGNDERIKQDSVATDNYTATNGAGMKSWVAGIFNPGNTNKAIDDAITMCKLTHDNPFALSAACSIAAATAKAMSPTSNLSDVIESALDGAIMGFDQTLYTTRRSAGASVYRRIQMAIEIGIKYSHDFERLIQEMADFVGTGLNANEAIPAALGFIVAAKGNVMDTIYMGVNCGYDTDTIASIGGAISGAYSGAKSIPDGHLEFLSEVNDFDIKKLAEDISKLEIYA